MKKILLGFILVLVLVVGVFAAQEVSSEVSDVVGAEISDFVENFVEKRGISSEAINNVTQVDFNELPKEVNIKNVGDNNLAIYQVDYNEKGKDKQVYVVTYSVEQLRAQGDLIVAHDKRMFLNFGLPGTQIGSGFLETSSGVQTDFEKGYVMPRDGSITAVSTNLEIFQGNPGTIEIIVYKNGQAIGFGNTFSAETSGVKKDYDVQSRDTVVFAAGDVISVYANVQGNSLWGDVITMVEITTLN